MMEQIKQPRMDRYDFAVFVIGMPFRGMQRAAKMTARAVASRVNAEKPEVPAEPAPEPVVAEPAPRTTLRAADRVHSHRFGSLQVHFYHYVKEAVIKAKARRDGVEKELLFTPADATSHALPFTLAGAVLFVGKQGFVHGQSASMALPLAAPEKAINEAPKQKQKPEPKRSEDVTTVEATPVNKAKRPFEGSVVSFGQTQRPGFNGEPPYTTFYLKLCNDLIGEREFIGEQLAELVEQHNLAAGQMVRLHPLGRRPFEVVVDGKTQKRHRNEYSIEIL